ncbi:hypothetical protein PNEG_02996 [Pneumocystis murina B123]|uniref:GRAM domain-containing protein n=1 Tax=Pneumocystis murina (strain B123) TaxID=1069680 RepID=M7NIT5_PNEMU|nr:hypothetical protein PNEG_02996 [Pneumocystis murina B123]EMR08513.1 hypothetical protein PNEG_02996 [Pneumocystis murina B123]
MSINSVDVNPENEPILLPFEQFFFCGNKVEFILECGNGYPANHIINKTYSSSSGRLYFSNHRIIYFPSQATASFKNFACPLNKFVDGSFIQPWFSSNYYQATVYPVPQGGLPSVASVKFIFKEGGGFDFATKFSDIQFRLHENNNDPRYVQHLEELPQYQAHDSSLLPNVNQLIIDDIPSLSYVNRDAPPNYEDVAKNK